MNNHTESNNSSTPEYIRQFLTDPPLLLNNFHYEDTMEFLQIGEIETYRQGQIIIEEHANVHSAFLITHGEVSIMKGNIKLTNLGKGGFLGEAFLFSKNNRMAKVISEGQSRLLHFQRYDTLNFFRKKPEKLFNIFTRNIIEIQRQKITGMNEQLAEMKQRLFDDNSLQ